jgi:hypothetical protein
VGIASVGEINKYSPLGYRPDDQLPGAKSVIILGGMYPTKGLWEAHPKVMIEIGPAVDGPVRHAAGLSYFLEERYGANLCPLSLIIPWVDHFREVPCRGRASSFTQRWPDLGSGL